MASSNIKSISIGIMVIQNGNGIPDHIAPKGTVYTDLDAVIEYINKNGVATWVQTSGGSTGTTDTNEVKVSSTDTTPNFLNEKLSGSTNLSLSIINPSGNEKILITPIGLATLSGATFTGPISATTLSANTLTLNTLTGTGTRIVEVDSLGNIITSENSGGQISASTIVYSGDIISQIDIEYINNPNKNVVLSYSGDLVNTIVTTQSGFDTKTITLMYDGDDNITGTTTY